MAHSYLGLDHVILGGYYGVSQVDVQRFVGTGYYKVGGIGITLMMPMVANNFDGNTYVNNIGSKKRELYTINYEVKTLSPKGDVSTIFDYLSKGIDQVNARGGSSKDKVLGVLITDSSVWNKVASDSKYGNLLKNKYDSMIKNGNYLQLVDGLNTEANSKLYGLRQQIRNAEGE